VQPADYVVSVVDRIGKAKADQFAMAALNLDV
jgi:hypothetical protein